MRRRHVRSTPIPSWDTRSGEALSLDAKIRIASVVVEDSLARFQKPIIMWTGGKDSMLVLWFFQKICDERNVPCPPVLFIDHGMHFDETWDFLDVVVNDLSLQKLVTRNEDLLSLAGEPGSRVSIKHLSEANQLEARRTGHRKALFPYDLGNLVANHLLKTVPMNEAIREHKFDAVVTGIRWDENEARSAERFVSPRSEPPHARVHPILHFTERDVWMETLRQDIPIHPLYERGFRSIDGKHDSQEVGNAPAWEQDLEGTSERAGRKQDKEQIMERLRQLGYM